MTEPFENAAQAAMALLHQHPHPPLTRKAGSFAGQCVVDATPLSKAQAEWLENLLLRAGLPGLAVGEDA